MAPNFTPPVRFRSCSHTLCVQRSQSCERVFATGHKTCSQECEHATHECVRHRFRYNLGQQMNLRFFLVLAAGMTTIPGQPPTLRQAAAKRGVLIGAAADADEYGHSNRLLEADYATTLGTNFSMLEGENAMKWDSIHPSQTTYNFGPGDHLVAFP